MTNTMKNILTIIVIVVVIFTAFKLFVPERESSVEEAFKTSTPGDNLTVASVTPTKEAAITLTKLKSVEINKNLFSRDAFKNLEDFRVEVFPVDVGRNNPFAPVGTD